MTILKTLLVTCLFTLNMAKVFALVPGSAGEVDLDYKIEINKPISLNLESELQKKIGTTEKLIFNVNVTRLPAWLNFNNNIFEGTPFEDDIGETYFSFDVTTEKSSLTYTIYLALDVYDSKIPDRFYFELNRNYGNVGSSYNYSFYLPATTKITGKHKTNKPLLNYVNLHEDGFIYGTLTELELLHFDKFVIPVEASSGKSFYVILKAPEGY